MRWLVVAIAVCGCHHGDAPPPAPGCSAVADHVLSLLEPKDEHARDVRGVFQVRCEQDRWPADVRACVVGTASLKDPKHSKAKLVISERARLDADLSAAAARARDRQVPESCRTYAGILERLMSCDRMPQAARDAMHQGYETLRQSWTSLDGNARAAADEGCRAAADAVKQTATAMGCDL